MHFVGMAAMHLNAPNGDRLPISYRIDLTIASLVIVVVLSYAGLYISSLDKLFTEDKSDVIDKFIKDARNLSIQEIRMIKRKETFLLHTLFRNPTKLVCGGLVTAMGVCIMHYLGMQAMIIDGQIHWNAGVIAASVIIAIIAATAAFWILFRLLALYPYVELLRLGSAFIASVAVNGMHYTGMAAATFEYIPGKSLLTSSYNTMSQRIAIMGALAASVLFMLIIGLVCIADLRVWYYNTARIIREMDIRTTLYKDTMNSAPQPFLTDYLQIRDTDGSANAILALRMKLSSSPNNSSIGKSSTVAPGKFDSEYVSVTDTETGLNATVNEATRIHTITDV
jgi:NO-binding membrane sensor protein with MHYT domain